VGRMRRSCLLLLIAVILAGLLAMAGEAVRANGPIQVAQNSHEVAFAEGITFRLQVETQRPIVKVTLFYQRAGEGLTVKVPISVALADTAFTHEWELEPGDVPVGEHIEYYWYIVDDAGNDLKTSPVELEYEDDRFTWKMLAEGDVVLFWYGSDEEQTERLLGYATTSLDRLQDEIGVALHQPVCIYVYQSKSDMSLALPRHSDAYDDRIVTLGVVVDDATLLILGSHPEVEGTMAHEICHIVVGLLTDNPYASLPRWLDEGLAMYSEGKLPGGNRRALDSAIRRDQLISVRSLSGYTGDPSQVDLFYGQVYSLLEFMLQTYGKEKMTDLLATISGGLYQEDALQQVYGFGLDELDAQWRESLGLQPRGAPDHATPEPTRSAGRGCVPCCFPIHGSLLGLVALAYGRRRARAA